MNNVLFGSEITVILHLFSLQKFSNFQFTTLKCLSHISVQGFQTNLKKKEKKRVLCSHQGIALDPPPTAIVLFLPKTGVPIFFLYYPLVSGMLTSLAKTCRKYI